MPAGAEIDYNVYFRHPGKDKLLRGLPYAQGVDLSPLAADSPFGLRLRRAAGGRHVAGRSAAGPERSTATRSPWTSSSGSPGANSYTRCYEDLFADFQQEDFRPRYHQPGGRPRRGPDGRGADRRRRAGRGRPGIRTSGPYAAPAAWWEDIDSGRATIVDGSVALDAAGPRLRAGHGGQAVCHAGQGRGVGPLGQPHLRQGLDLPPHGHADHVLAGAGSVAQRISRPPAGVQPVGVHRAGAAGSRSTPAGLYRLRDWHTFLGYNCRLNAWMLDFYGNSRIGGPGENVTSLSRNAAQRAEPFRPIRYLTLDRDTPQVLADGVALQQAGGVLGLEEFSIGTMSAWGRDVSHLRPGSFMVGRRDFLLSRAVGQAPLQDGQVVPGRPQPPSGDELPHRRPRRRLCLRVRRPAGASCGTRSTRIPAAIGCGNSIRP